MTRGRARARCRRARVATPPARRRARDRGRYFLPSTVSFRLFARRNLHTRLAGILIGSPVWGLRPIRAFRFASTSLPKPGSRNTPDFFASLAASASVSSRKLSTCFFERLVFSARAASVADFVIVFATGVLLSALVSERETD